MTGPGARRYSFNYQLSRECPPLAASGKSVVQMLLPQQMSGQQQFLFFVCLFFRAPPAAYGTLKRIFSVRNLRALCHCELLKRHLWVCCILRHL